MPATAFDPTLAVRGHLWLHEGKRKQVWRPHPPDHPGPWIEGTRFDLID